MSGWPLVGQNFDGYMAEVNFVDGQQLTPFAFGNFNPTTGVWGANKYVGTYGTNGFYLPFTDNSNLTFTGNYGLGRDFSGNANYWATYNISLAQNATVVSFTNTGTTAFTVPPGVTSMQYLVVAGGGSGGGEEGGGGGAGGMLQGNINVVPGQTLNITVGAGGASTNAAAGLNGSNSSIIGGSAVVIAVGGGAGGAVNTANSAGSGGSGGGGGRTSTSPTIGGSGISGQGYSGGTGQTTSGYASAGGGGAGGQGGNGTNNNPGGVGGSGGNGLISYITGTGVYYAGGGGGGGGNNNGNPSPGAGGLGGGGAGGAAGSGLTPGNPGTPNTGGGGGGAGQGSVGAEFGGAGGSGIVILSYNGSGSGPTYDSMLDSPTRTSGVVANYCVLNPLNTNNNLTATVTISNANLQFVGSNSTTNQMVGTSIGFSSGRWYCEAQLTVVGGNFPFAGIVLASSNITGTANASVAAFSSYWIGNGTLNVNDLVGIAVDMNALTIQFYQNGLAIGTPTSIAAGTYMFAFSGFNGCTWIANFGQRPFAYSPPSGFDPLNTYNLASPTIPAGNVAVNAITFTGGPVTPLGLGQIPKRTASTLAPVNSLRLRSGNSGYLNRTPFIAGNPNTWTFSAWVKRGTTSSSASYALFTAGYAAAPWLYVGFNNDNMYLSYTAGVSSTGQVVSNAVLRDVSQWYHLVWAIDTTQTVASNRVQFYVNGQQVTSFLQATYPSQFQSLFANTLVGHQIGGYTGQFYDGYITEINFVDGQQLLPSAFGATNTDGQWVPIPYIGTYGTNGFRLPFTGNQTQTFNGSFNGSSQWVSTGTASNAFNLAQGNWTVEGWYYSNTTQSNSARYMTFVPGLALGADTSGTNNTVTVSGTPTWNQFSPYGTSTQGGSLYFNGTNNSLVTNNSTGNFLFGNGNFTVEAWIYPLNVSAVQYIASVWGVVGQADNTYSSWLLRINASGNLETVLNNGSANTTLTGSTVLTLRQWQHVALVRYNNAITLFVNGVNVGSTAYTSTLNTTTNQFVIGQQLSNSYYFNGYLTNLRIVNGTALYTTSWFTPPTAALPIVNSTQTVLLMDVGSAGAYITDSSSYAQTLTVNGTLAYNAASPYSPVNLGGSAYLDGSSANFNVTTVSAFQLATANTPFTVECWVYPVTQLNGTGIITGSFPGSGNIPFVIAGATSLASSNGSGSFLSAGYFNGSSYQMVIQTATSLTLNTWSHIALSYDGTTARLFLNGIQLGSVTGAWTTAAIQSPLYIGRRWDTGGTLSFFNGYITNVRFVNGISQYGQNFTPVTTQALSTVPGTVLLMNTTSNGNTWGLLPYTNTDFTLNLFGQGFNPLVTVNGSMKLNVWQHIALVRNGQVTTLYINGVASAASVYPWWTNGTVTVFFGGVSGTYANYFQGQISNFRIVMGTAVYTANFTPSTVPLTVIPGTALLTMNSSTVTDSAGVTNLTNNNSVTMAAASPFQANISIDYSGNNNNWFVNNVGMVTNTLTFDTMTDVPADSSNVAANWSVLNQNDANPSNYMVVSNGGLICTGVGSGQSYGAGRIRSTVAMWSGKWYAEYTLINYNSGGAIGITAFGGWALGTGDIGNPISGGNTTYEWGFRFNDSAKIFNTTYTTLNSGTQVTNGQIVMCALDLTNGYIWWGLNGTWYQGGNPATGANPAFTGVTTAGGPLTFAMGWGNGTSISVNLNQGQNGFVYTPPVGFSAPNTFTNSVGNTYYGSGTGYPDFTWIKSRSNATSHMLMDTVRGPSLYLNSDTTNPQYGSGGAYNWSKYGLVLANDGNTNVAGNTYVLWGWTAGQGNVSVNSSGTIASTVSTNPVAGFSIVTYPGNGQNGATVGHGLNVTPAMVMIKGTNSSTGGSNWLVWHQSISQSGWTNSATFTTSSIASILLLNSTSQGLSYVFDAQINGVGGTYVAYCWAAVPGYSAFGSYAGNASTDGPFIYTGFRPRWIMIKGASFTSDWVILDTVRNTYNAATSTLFPDLTAAETTGAAYPNIDILSNGWKMRSTSAYVNSNALFIYAAFAENPFKYAVAR